jgi:hypothetical protein
MNTKKQDIAKLIVFMGELFDKEMSETKIQFYVNCLNDYSMNQIKDALSRACKKSKFMPRPAEILEYLEPSAEDKSAEIELRANNAATKATEFIMFKSSYHFDDPIAQATMQSIGFQQWKDGTQDNFDRYFRISFVKTYKTLANSPQVSLQLQEAQEKQERLEYYKNGGGLLK